MSKKKKKYSPFPFIKKTSLTGIIAFLILTLIKITESSFTQTELPTSDQSVQIYSNQIRDDLTQIYSTAILNAKESIHFVIYSLLDPTILKHLHDKCEAGIPVYVVCDAKASPGISKKLPKAKIVRRAGKGITHQKILVVDGKQMFIGSANMTTDSLRKHGNLVMGLENVGLAKNVIAKIESMDEESGSQVTPHQKTMAKDQHIELWILPDDKNAVTRMKELFRAAKKSIRVAMFTWTRQDFTEELIQAAKRGVKVEAVLDRYSGQGASASVVKRLAKENIPVRLSTGQGLLHHKFAYIDEEILVNGSANWTSAAFKVNDDDFIVLYPLNEEQKNKLNQLWEFLLKESEEAF